MENVEVYHIRSLSKLLFVKLLLYCLVSRAPNYVIAIGDDEDLVSQFLVPQNQARAQVGDPPFVWDENVTSYAQAYANERRGDCALKHSNGPFGENIFWGGGSDWQPKDAVAAWIGEDRFFNYQTHSCDGYEECGHYTQIVWKDSRKLGCARVICDDGDTFMTCNYDPPGNYIGQNPY